MTDYTPEPNLDVLARYTAELGERIREEDPRQMFDHLQHLCRRHPAKAAQMLMVFAAWFDPEVPTSVLTSRASAITACRIGRMA